MFNIQYWKLECVYNALVLHTFSFLPSDQFKKLCKYAGDGKKNRSRKPMTITICNQILLKISVIDENEIDDTAYCYT